MKSIKLLSITLSLLICLTACGSKESSTEAEMTTTEVTTEVTTEATTEAITEATTEVATEATTEKSKDDSKDKKNTSTDAEEDKSVSEPVREEPTTAISSDGYRLSNDSSDFVLISDAVPDAVLEIRYYTDYNFVGEQIDGYEEPVALLTTEAATQLKAVNDELEEQGYCIKIYDAYRPQMAVDNFVEWAEDIDDTKIKDYFYPEVDKTNLFSQGYIAKHSGHSRGSTVDLTIVDMSTGKDVDMGGTFDYFGQLSHSDYTGITEEQYANRMILRNAMTNHGFKAITTEWWHFSLINEPYPDTYFTFPVSSKSVE